MNIPSKINKILKALEVYGFIYMINKESIYIKDKQKVSSIYKLFNLLPVEEYNKLHPDDKKDINKYEFVKVEILKTFSQIEILLELIDIYKKVGVINE